MKKFNSPKQIVKKESQKCDGDGLIIVGWDEEAYENIEGTCPECKGSGKIIINDESL
jgi:DnaJ-class molecular chaperone